ncbi:MAG: ADP-ribosylglycohydrolase family protein [Bacteroides sp.]|nr:ADP-ribosylglycohydrolase family protein [Bacteroides sp.]
MKKYLLIISITSLFACSQRVSHKEISLDEYRDKMKGAWIGQMAGVGWGLPTEFDFIDVIIPEEKLPDWEAGMINQQGNDDLFVEMTFLSSMEKYGIDVDNKQAGIDFANTGYGLWAANRTGRENLRSGMAPPESGHPLHNANCEDIDYQIEADYSGIIAPGMPNVAISLGEKFGRIMNYGDGVYGGQFVGGMYASAYFSNDIEKIIREGLKCIPAESNYAQCVRDVISWHSEYPDDWEKCWEEIMNKYYRTLDYQPFHQQNSEAWVGIDAKVNGAFIVLGLLYGAGDMDQTILYSMRCGLDSDCNPSNAAGILATCIGFDKLPEKFKAGLDASKKFSYSDYDFNDLLRVSEFFTREFVIREGGKIVKNKQGEEYFFIKNNKPLPSDFEPAYAPGAFDETNRYNSAEYSEIVAYSYKNFAPLLEEVAPGWKLFNAGKGSQTALLEFDGRDKVLVITPMSVQRSAYLEFTLQNINVNDDGVEQTGKGFSTGIASFFLTSEVHKPWFFSFTVRGEGGRSLTEETIDGAEMKGWEKIEVPFDITEGQLPKIRLDIHGHDGKLNKAYISGLSVSLK